MLAALQVRALLVLVGVVLIPYERTCIEVLACVCCITGLACWCLVACYWCLLLVFVTGVCCITGLACWCLLLVLAALRVRALLVLVGVVLIPYERTCIEVLACVVLIPYERTCIEVLAGVCCITGLACWCLLVWY